MQEVLSELDNLTLWPEKVKLCKKLDGKSVGAEIDFKLTKLIKKLKFYH